MTSMSPDETVLRDVPADGVAAAASGPDLRVGRWTRLGQTAVLGDRAAESTLQALAERTRAAAQAQGFATGWAHGFQAARERAEADIDADRRGREEERSRWRLEHDLAVQALRSAVDRLDDAYHAAIDAVATQAVELAMQVAEAVLGREIEGSPAPAADAVRRALRALPDERQVIVRLHPDDRALLADGAWEGCSVRLVDDPLLCRGDAVAETDDAVVDATVAAALDRVRQVLTR